MDLFISWSGNRSKRLAEILSEWLPAVIQAVNPYFTPDDISKGTRWNSEISKALDSCQIGLICVTSDNFRAPWINFEAGALSKNLDKSRVCPILFGIEPTDITGPLVHFQLTQFNKDDFKRLIIMINSELGDNKIRDNTLNTIFEMGWPKLEEKVKEESSHQTQSTDTSSKRTDRELLEELVSMFRDTVENDAASRDESRIDPRAITDLVNYFSILVHKINKLDDAYSLRSILKSIVPILDYLIRRTGGTSSTLEILSDMTTTINSISSSKLSDEATYLLEQLASSQTKD